MVTYIGGYMDELDKSSGMFFSVKNWSDCKDVLERELSRFVFGNIKCELFDDFLKITITYGTFYADKGEEKKEL